MQPPRRLVLWNIDLTLVDVGRVTRAAYADAFRRVTGRPLVQLPQTAGSIESEVFFEAVELNTHGSDPGDGTGDALLARFMDELATAFAARRGQLAKQGRLLPGALAAVTAVGQLPGLVQTVLTGSIAPNAIEKLRAFGLDEHLDTEIGGYGSDVYPKGAMLLNARGRAAEKYAADFTEDATVYIADSPRDMEAARVGGARGMAVATGRSSAGELRDAGAYLILPDLADTAAVVEAVEELTVAFLP
ncbi:MAG TPA: haloacid dehalogenase-like hydrolase [Streptosporangiaceae bacterium]